MMSFQIQSLILRYSTIHHAGCLRLQNSLWVHFWIQFEFCSYICVCKLWTSYFIRLRLQRLNLQPICSRHLSPHARFAWLNFYTSLRSLITRINFKFKIWREFHIDIINSSLTFLFKVVLMSRLCYSNLLFSLYGANRWFAFLIFIMLFNHLREVTFPH